MTHYSKKLEPFYRGWERVGLLPDLRTRSEVALYGAAAGAVNFWRHTKAARDARSGYPALRRKFRHQVGYDLNLETPATFNEKLQWRKIHDKDPIFVELSDKSAAKDWIAARVGSEHLMPTLFRVTSPLDLPQGIEREEVVLKCTHTSGRSLFCGPQSGLSRSDVVRRFAQWLPLDYGTLAQEWGYQGVPKAIIGEPIVKTSDGAPPVDAKFHMFDGELRYIQFTDNKRDTDQGLLHNIGHLYLWPDWSPSDIARKGDPNMHAPPKPDDLDRMTQIARSIARGFDYLRVDFLLLGDSFMIGETTVYSSSGLKPFESREIDDAIGAYWTLPSIEDIRSGAVHSRRIAG